MINPDIEKFAKKLLTEEQLLDIKVIYNGLSAEEHRTVAIKKLQEIVGLKPKRPLYYVHGRLKHLPKDTRDIVRYLGDYIDHLIKFYASDSLTFTPRFFSERRSLGANLKKLRGTLGEELRIILMKYCDLIYTPAKHDMFPSEEKEHLFSCEDTVFIVFITMELSKQLLPLSQKTRDYTENKIHEYNGRI